MVRPIRSPTPLHITINDRIWRRPPDQWTPRRSTILEAPQGGHVPTIPRWKRTTLLLRINHSLQPQISTHTVYIRKNTTQGPLPGGFSQDPPISGHKTAPRRVRRGCRGGWKKGQMRKSPHSTSTIRIFNLSATSLTPLEIILLQKGLNFAPFTPPNVFKLFLNCSRI